ncbi:hypothetical protein [Sphaerisporangium aureirubrum]|uniref:AraC family transcriptional regulator n=1 Tax=Sphaerisporangium aureirubrum TaxID=1544736 RepID=A0ABW1NC85_9ACTN
MSPDPDLRADFGEFALLDPLLVLKERLEKAHVPDNLHLMWILPSGVLAGAGNAYGMTVVRADVPAPMLAFRPPGEHEVLEARP